MNGRSIKPIVPGNGMAVKVLGPKPNDIEHALRSWKGKVKDNEIIEQYRDRQEYEKPTAKRRRLKDRAIFDAKHNVTK
jgi:ribosomal protein S21